MEKRDYRINYELLLKKFPNRATISTKEAAELLGCSDRTIRSAITRAKNKLPAQKLGKSLWVIAIPSFARWLSSEGE